jgi:hypothetical protein
MNYRSEPFGINNLAEQEKMFHYEDESLSYSSYTFGDVPTTVPRSYLGDPAKFRLRAAIRPVDGDLGLGAT